MGEWGWRVPFFIGCLIVPALFVIRRSLEETPEFEARTHRPSLSQVLRSIGQNFGVVLAGTAMVVMTTVSFYLITAYTPTFGKNELQLSDLDSLLVTMCIGLSNFIWLPVMGAFSDRIGRKPLLLGASALALLTAYPRCPGWSASRVSPACSASSCGCRSSTAATTARWWWR